jgi:hypothetical protein
MKLISTVLLATISLVTMKIRRTKDIWTDLQNAVTGTDRTTIMNAAKAVCNAQRAKGKPECTNEAASCDKLKGCWGKTNCESQTNVYAYAVSTQCAIPPA